MEAFEEREQLVHTRLRAEHRRERAEVLRDVLAHLLVARRERDARGVLRLLRQLLEHREDLREDRGGVELRAEVACAGSWRLDAP